MSAWRIEFVFGFFLGFVSSRFGICLCVCQCEYGVCVCVLIFFGAGLRALCATRWPCKWSEWATASQSGNFRNVLEALLLYSFSHSFIYTSLSLSPSLPLALSLGSSLSFGLTCCSFSGCAVPFYASYSHSHSFTLGICMCVACYTLYVSYGYVCMCVSWHQLRFKLHIKFMRVRLLFTCACVCWCRYFWLVPALLLIPWIHKNAQKVLSKIC